MNNCGHGHVYPNEDGTKARCGGPGICVLCSLDAARKTGDGIAGTNGSQDAPQVALVQTTGHNDPIARLAQDEPHITFLGRDMLAPDLVTIYLAGLKRDSALVDAAVKRFKELMMTRTHRPDKDPDHIRSAQKIANEMRLWYIEHANKPVDVDDAPPEP